MQTVQSGVGYLISPGVPFTGLDSRNIGIFHLEGAKFSKTVYNSSKVVKKWLDCDFKATKTHYTLKS